MTFETNISTDGRESTEDQLERMATEIARDHGFPAPVSLERDVARACWSIEFAVDGLSYEVLLHDEFILHGEESVEKRLGCKIRQIVSRHRNHNQP